MEKGETKTCKNCKKTFLVTVQEQAFYKRKNLPGPAICFQCRRERRTTLRNKRKLYERTCDKCKTALSSTYPKESPYIVYCEKCYFDSLGN